MKRGKDAWLEKDGNTGNMLVMPSGLPTMFTRYREYDDRDSMLRALSGEYWGATKPPTTRAEWELAREYELGAPRRFRRFCREWFGDGLYKIRVLLALKIAGKWVEEKD